MLSLPYRRNTVLASVLSFSIELSNNIGGIEYVTGDRFSPEFLERRRQERAITLYPLTWSNNLCSLELFLKRLSRPPTLQRSTLVRAFFESTEWVGLCPLTDLCHLS